MSWVRFRDGQAHGFGLLGPGLAQVWREILRWPIGPGFIFWVQIQNINFSFLILSLYINLSPLESVYVTIKAYFNQNIIHHRISRYLQKAKNNVTGAFLVCAEMF